MNIVALILIGLCAGVLSGMLGIGGGIIIVPALMYFLGFDQLKAQGTSIALMLPPIGILAFLEYHKNGKVDIVAGVIICAMMILGAKYGSKIAHAIPADMLKKGFSVLLLLTAVKMFFGK